MKRALFATIALCACARGSEVDSAGGLIVPATDAQTVGDGCGMIEVKFVKRTPTVLLLLDQSRSMEIGFGASGLSRWQALRESLTGKEGVVRRFDGDVRFGATLYRSFFGYAGGACPILTSTPIELHATADVDRLLSDHVPEGGTPTGESIDAVVPSLLALPDDGAPRVLVLATDGEPDTCSLPNPDLGQPDSVFAAQMAFARGIRTFVISVGTGISLGHLQDMANAGAGIPSGSPEKAPFYSALDAPALLAAFDDIVHGARACFLPLEWSVSDVAAGTVSLDGEPLERDKLTDGWTLQRPGTVVLLGSACDKVKSGDHDVRVRFPCEALVR